MTLLCKAIFYFPCIPNNRCENPCLLYSKIVCLYFSDHMCIVQAEDRGFHVIILLSGNLILQSLLFHCHFQMFNEATHGYEIPLVFLLPSLHHFQSQKYWIKYMEIYLPGLLFTSWTELPLEAMRNVANNPGVSLLFFSTLPVWKNIKKPHSQLIGLVCSLAKYYH